MRKPRPSIPRAIKDSVLREFNHRCAICGKERPQVHHIDENPSNNDPMNLIPLCPNCHLTDQHNPTMPIDSEKLRLFRQFKDPIILKPQFHPLFIRMQFLSSIDESVSAKNLTALSEELIEFVEVLEMGGFYAKRISELIKRNYTGMLQAVDSRHGVLLVPEPVENDQQYIEKLRDAYPKVAALIVELLRFQKWQD
jgi:hypothetical protein